MAPVEMAQSDESEGDFGAEKPSASSPPPKLRSDAAATEKPSNAAAPPEAPIILSPPQTLKPDVYNLVWRSGRDGGLPINAYFVKYRKVTLLRRLEAVHRGGRVALLRVARGAENCCRAGVNQNVVSGWREQNVKYSWAMMLPWPRQQLVLGMTTVGHQYAVLPSFK